MPTFPNGGLKSVLRGYLNDTGLRKNNFSNSRAPLTSDNASQGYEVGSLWTYDNLLYVLTDIAGETATWTANAGPKGDQGDPGTNGADGQNGADGADGADGLSAYELAIQEGFVGSLQDWLDSLVGPEGPPGADGQNGADGADGLSAYELAIQEGFIGSLQDWLDSLVGPEGPPGADASNTIVVLTQTEYDALVEYDPNVTYLIIDVE